MSAEAGISSSPSNDVESFTRRLGSRAVAQLPPRRYLLRSDGEIVMVLDDRRWLGDCISSRVTDIQTVINP